MTLLVTHTHIGRPESVRRVVAREGMWGRGEEVRRASFRNLQLRLLLCLLRPPVLFVQLLDDGKIVLLQCWPLQLESRRYLSGEMERWYE